MTHLKTIPAAADVQGIEFCPDFLSPESLAQQPVFLISANLPCCGGTTIANAIGQRIVAQGFELELVNVGDTIRKKLGVNREQDFAQVLDQVDDPTQFDPLIYGKLPPDKVCVIDGKLATTVGPSYINSDRPIYSINLDSDLITSAIRNLGREDVSLSRVLTSDARQLLARLSMLSARAAHDSAMRETIKASNASEDEMEPTLPFSFRVDGMEMKKDTPSDALNVYINTNSMCREEILEYFSGNPRSIRFDKYVPEWEIAALRNTLATLKYLRVMFEEKSHRSDQHHYEFQYNAASYNVDRLKTTLDPVGIREIRQDIKNALVDSWFGLMMKQVPRFFEDPEGNYSLDTVSHAWTPEYYKIAEGWPVLKTMLKGKNILDPFGGAGTLVNLLAARGIIKSAVLSDLSYWDGEPIDDSGHTYATQLNSQMAHVLFDDLPSWYKPDLSVIKGRYTANATKLLFPDKSFDYVVTDPPYGKNHGSGGIGLTIGCLPEFERVTTEGTIMMLPTTSTRGGTDWAKEIENAGYPVKYLTKDVSRGNSGYPVCYIKIGHRKHK